MILSIQSIYNCFKLIEYYSYLSGHNFLGTELYLLLLNK